MLSAPDLIIACPHCQALARIFQTPSGSLFGAITWTDGWHDAPLLPRPPRITRCRACHGAYWTSEAALIGYTAPDESPGQQPKAWSDAPTVEPLDEQDLLRALGEGIAYSPHLELELRVAIWWRGNDTFRVREGVGGFPTSNAAVANMERFIELMTDGEEDLLLFRAEGQRQLGDFQGAEETLRSVGCSDYWPAKSRLLSLIQANDRCLRVMFEG